MGRPGLAFLLSCICHLWVEGKSPKPMFLIALHFLCPSIHGV